MSFEVDGGSRRILDLVGVGRRAFGLVADTDTRFRPDGAFLVEPLDIVIELCQPGIGQLLVRETRRVSVSSLGEHDCDLIAEVLPLLEQWRQGRVLVGARFEHATRVVKREELLVELFESGQQGGRDVCGRQVVVPDV